MLEIVEKELKIRQNILNEVCETLQSYIYTVSIMIGETFKQGGKIVLFGDGRDGEIARYFSDELNEKLVGDDVILPAVVLDCALVDMDIFGSDKVFEKKLGAVAISKDMLIGVSLCGHDKGVLRALSLGKNLGCRVVGFSGSDGEIMSEFCDINIEIPSENPSLSREMMFLLAGVITDVVKAGIEEKENA
jgi:D-sedoheptulose 7-phosphate isomerase